MNIEELYDYCISIPGVEQTFPFDEVTLVMKLMGKVIALIPLDAEVKLISLKCDPDKAIELREQYSSVQAAFHMNKRYWNSIELSGDMLDEEIKRWIHHSIDEVVKKMPKKSKKNIMEVQKGDRIVINLDETSSTNTELKLLQKQSALPEGSVVMTDFQTSGRGQAGNSWYSGRGKNLLLSFLLYPHSVKARDQFIISRIVSLAIKRVLDRHLENVTIKWPNDIYWNDKKIAGILIENSLTGQHIDHTIIGIGLNVNEEQFPKQLPNPISIKQIVRAELDRDLLFADLSNDLFQLYQSLGRGETELIEQEYMQHLYRREGVHWFSDNDGRFKATIKTVLPSGHLVLTTFPEKEERVYAFKEVAFGVEESEV